MRLRTLLGWTASIVAGGLLCGGLVSHGLGGASPAASAVAAVQTNAQQPPLIVHEWGTFTSFSGSDGVKLEFRPLEEKDLPRFVFNRHSVFSEWLSKSSLPAIQRMETPVTYFYTPVERDVTVKVAFPQGLLTEYYPPVRALAPELAEMQKAQSESVALKDSWLDWGQVHLIPPDSLRAAVQDDELARRFGRHLEQTMTPEASGFPHYVAARDTDSAIVQVRHLPQADKFMMAPRPGDYFEKFLFYRGLGNFDLPLTLASTDGVSFTLTNSGNDDVRSLFLVTVRGKDISFRHYSRVAADSRLAMTLPDRAATLDDLSQAVTRALVAEGLYDKEAQAMVNAWKSSWFGEEGTRLFYILPQKLTDELLPLQISPSPTELVRVLVGRMEIMTPAQEAEILEAVGRSAALRSQLKKGMRSPVVADLTRLGRLGEPALVRAEHLARTDELRREARQLIKELRAASDENAGG